MASVRMYLFGYESSLPATARYRYAEKLFFSAPENPRVIIFGTGAGCNCFLLTTGSYVVAIGVTAPSLDFVLIAAYAPPHATIEPILDQISDCIGRCDGAMVVVAGDLNAKDSNWGGVITDARGAAILQLACQCDLHVLNDLTSDPTFETAYAESWIDVTLASSAMISRGHDWAVLEDLTLPDHRLIAFSFPFARPLPRKKLTFQGKADLLCQLAGEPWFDVVTRADLRSGAALDAVLEKFYLIYSRAHARHLRNTKTGPHRANTWWTPELGSERGRVLAIRRKYQRARDPDMRAPLRDVFAAARAQYRAQIRDARECALNRYCTDCSKKSIFGAPFKAAFGKARPPVPPTFFDPRAALARITPEQYPGLLASKRNRALLTRIHSVISRAMPDSSGGVAFPDAT
ncbi:hypothetical protein HPB49_009824 [Dermacentor silvarum]|uniref:Uncharacterized protein n=1 Tax=Dermacentor silvarum TaxID=543639 RepID=A0ACB8DYX3_DERSI|nr:hypothetical protein HPB49_009824 [Dermacentor silvarum]